MLEMNKILIHVIAASSLMLTSINSASVVTESYSYSNPVATTPTILNITSTSLLRLHKLVARGLMDTDTPDHGESEKAIKNDPWQGYYEFLINEGSFKFWAVFQVVTAVILIYSAFAAVYYAKYNFVQADYDYGGDYFFGRSDNERSNNNDMWSGLSSQTFQRILDAISSKKYS